MSSLRLKNVVKQHTYRERHQPKAREHLGSLEKHKDYVERARDFHKKEGALQRLQLKAALRNPDEFDHKMISSRMEDGHHRKIVKQPSNKQVVDDQRRQSTVLLSKEVTESKSIARDKAALQFLLGEQHSEHVFFKESEREVRRFDPARELDTHPSLLALPYNRPTLEQLQSDEFREKLAAVTEEDVAELEGARKRTIASLESRAEHVGKLKRLRAVVDTKVKSASGGRRVLVRKAKAGKPAIYRWKSERRR